MPDPGGSTKRNPGSRFGTDLLIVTTVGVTLAAHYRGQLRYLSASGIRVQIASNPDADLLSAAEAEGVPCHGVRMSRRISPVRDVASVFHMILLLRRLRPAVVCYGTPKAALVTSFAAAIMRVPSRIYTVHGLRLE